VLKAVTGMQAAASRLLLKEGVGRDLCMRGMMTRNSRPSKLVHTDVCGPMDVKKSDKHLFQVVAIDDFSSYRAVVPVAKKGLFKNELIMTRNQWEAQLEVKVKNIRRNGGDKYAGASIGAWVDGKGIQIQTSIRYS